MGLVVPPKDNDWTGVRKAFRKLSRQLEHVSFYGFTASRLISTDSNQKLASVSDLTTWIAGTSNQITVTDDTDGTVTLSTPQDIHTGATAFTVAGEAIIPATSTTNALGIKASGDAANRFQIRADGLTEWGNGTDAVDTNLYRSAASYLKTDDTFEANIVYGTAGVIVKNANKLYLFSDNDLYSNTFVSPTGMGATVNYTLPATDGNANEVLQTNGSGVLSWVALGTAAGGSTTEIQYNNGGTLDGIASLTFDGSNVFSTANTIWRGGTGIVSYDADNSNFFALRSAAVTTQDRIYYWPAADGTNGQILSTNGSGVLSWAANAAVPAGDSYDIQYNANGSMGGTGEFQILYNNSPKVIQFIGVQVWLNNQTPIRFIETGGSNFVALKGPTAVTTDVTYTLPEDGTNTQCLITNGSGTLSWTGHDGLAGFVANEHIDHTSVSISTSTGLTGGGDISSTRTLSLSHLGIESLSDPNADRILFWDDGAGATAWLTATEGVQISTTNLKADIGSLSADASPDSAADYVMTLDATDSTHKKVLLTNLPAGATTGFTSKCYVQLTSNQSVTTGTPTKILLDNEFYDVDNEFDSSTNYRFTATSAGYYHVNACTSFQALNDTDVNITQIRVNGTEVSQVNVYDAKNAGSPGVGYAQDIYLAANDYVELYGYHDYGANRNCLAGIFTFLGIHRFA